MTGLLNTLPMSWALGLALFAGRGRSRVSTATIVSVLGIGVGVATLTAVLAVTGGFEEALRERILGVYPHMVILSRGEQFSDYKAAEERLKRMPGVLGTNPSTYDEMMISSDFASAGTIVKGVDLNGVDEVSGLRALIEPPASLDDIRFAEGRQMGVIVGCELMARLRAGPGSRVTLTTPVRGIEGRTIGPFGMAPMQEPFEVRGCFTSGFYEYDSRLVVMDLPSAQRFLNRGAAVRWIELRIDDMFATDRMRAEVLSRLQPYGLADVVRDSLRLREYLETAAGRDLAAAKSVMDIIRSSARAHRALAYSDLGDGPPQRYRVIDWKEMNRNLFSALRMQKVVLALFFLIIVVVAAFNIVGTQVMVARERVREVSTLVALGASRRQMYRVFVAHGFTLGCAGVAIGLGLGWVVVQVIRSLDFALDPKVYMITELPAELHGWDAVTIGGLSALVVLVSCMLSSIRATRLNPVDGLRKIA